MNLPSEHHTSRFSPLVQKALAQSGWTPQRTVPETQLKEWYLLKSREEILGYKIFPAALAALKEFGGLHIKPLQEGELYESVHLHFDPLATADFLGELWFTCEWVLETSLYPLGYLESSDDQYFVAIDQRGRIYTFAYELTLLGDTLDEAIEKCLTGSDDGQPVEFSEQKGDEAVAVYSMILSKL